MKRRQFSRLLAGATMLASPAVRAQGQTAGVALVIGNSKYKWEASLPNVKRDAPDVAKRFQALGLKTELLQDVGRDAMRRTIDTFRSASRGANLAAFYFAGHGASWDKDTYLVPEDADLANPGTVQSLLPVTAVRDAVKEANHRLLVFDNCRNNPADGWRQTAAIAAARVDATDLAEAVLNEPDTLTLYSTASGRAALDGPPGQNSPFAAALLRQLAAPSVDLQTLPEKLRRDLLIATECRQLVWDHNTYSQPFALKGAGDPAVSNSGSGRDPSRIVELPNAYAFARAKGLLLPAGMIAWRPPAGSPHAHKVGAYESVWFASIGKSYNLTVVPTLVLVLAVAGDAAELVNTTKDWSGGKGSFWRSFPATLSGDRLNYWSTSGTMFYELKWKDANSGNFGGVPHGGGSMLGNVLKPFKRLDG